MLTATCSAVGSLLLAPIRGAATEAISPGDEPAASARRLDSKWQFRQGAIGGIEAVWSPEEAGLWQTANLPHCFNAHDACDPDKPYFRGQGWYRIRLPLNTPFADGRTLLHFQGAGQTTTLWVGSTLIGVHKGGYDEFAFDFTEAVQHLGLADKKAGVPIAVLCDNSPDRDRVPSELSDFCLYGGLYRYVNLVYLPTVALDAVHIMPTVAADESAHVSVKIRLYNPSEQTFPCSISIRISDPVGQSIYEATQTLSTWAGFTELADFPLAKPEL